MDWAMPLCPDIPPLPAKFGKNGFPLPIPIILAMLMGGFIPAPKPIPTGEDFILVISLVIMFFMFPGEFKPVSPVPIGEGLFIPAISFVIILFMFIGELKPPTPILIELVFFMLDINLDIMLFIFIGEFIPPRPIPIEEGFMLDINFVIILPLGIFIFPIKFDMPPNPIPFFWPPIRFIIAFIFMGFPPPIMDAMPPILDWDFIPVMPNPGFMLLISLAIAPRPIEDCPTPRPWPIPIGFMPPMRLDMAPKFMGDLPPMGLNLPAPSIPGMVMPKPPPMPGIILASICCMAVFFFGGSFSRAFPNLMLRENCSLPLLSSCSARML